MEIICNLNGKSFKLEDESSRSSSASSTGSKPLIRNKININTNSISNNNNNNTKSQILDLIKNDDVNMFVSTNYDEEDDSEKIFCICRRKNSDSEDDDMMIECDICKDWLHFKCVNINQRISIDIETYVCPRCVSDTNNIVYKKRQNNHRHDYSDSNAAKKAVQAGTRVFVENLLKREFPDAIENNIVIKLDGSQVTLDYLEKNGFDKPILVEKKHGLNFNIPHKDEIDLTKIEDIVGSDVLLDVIDVERQQTVPMTINELNSYFRQEKREKVYNLISFEISKTKLSENVTPPNIVNEISWISNGVWPNDEDNLNNGINNINNSNNSSTIKNNVIKPEVQKYCLISAGSSYTDFHIDFGGSSVWYHVVKGDKIFYLIEPNSENLDAYEKWNSLKNHSEVFLADRVKNCYKFYIEAGNTIFLPTGWIHAVYTPQDSLVFGGNFLQCYNIPLQIKVYDMELRLKTPEKYRFPAFETLQWYAAKYYTQIIKEFNATRKIVDQRLLNGLKYLQNTLKKWINSKDYYQLHDHEIPRRINCDKLVKIMHKELGKAEMNFKLNGAYQKSDNKLKQNKFETTEMINHLDRKRMFIDGSNDNSTDEEKLSSMKHKDLSSTKKQKEVLNYGDMNLLEIKLDSELDATDENIISETNISIKQELPNMNENSTEPKKEPLILKIPKAIAIQAENQPTTSTGTLKLKLKITNPDSKATKKEKTLDELIRKENDNDSNKPNDEDDEIIKELTKHSYADSEYFYPSLSENKSKRKSNEKEEHDPNAPTADIAKSGRKRKLKPHAAQYLQPPKQTKKKDETTVEGEKAGETSTVKKKSKKSVDKMKDKNLNDQSTDAAVTSKKTKSDDDEDYVDDGEDVDDEDFKLKCKNNLKLSKKIKKNLIKQQQKGESQNDSANSTLESGETGSNSNPSTNKNNKPTSSTSSSSNNNNKSKPNESNKKFKKGLTTTKQRLGKLLKLNRVVNI